jgi:hypothetical protein
LAAVQQGVERLDLDASINAEVSYAIMAVTAACIAVSRVTR